MSKTRFDRSPNERAFARFLLEALRGWFSGLSSVFSKEGANGFSSAFEAENSGLPAPKLGL